MMDLLLENTKSLLREIEFRCGALRLATEHCGISLTHLELKSLEESLALLTQVLGHVKARRDYGG